MPTASLVRPHAHLLLNASSAGPAVAPDLLGHNLEFTRHDLFAGLSAELLANRKFIGLAPCSGTPKPDYSCWPAAEQRLVAAAAVPRWTLFGGAALDQP